MWVTDKGVYCYKAMLHYLLVQVYVALLGECRVMYKCLVVKRQNMEVYVNDMVVKIKQG